MMQARETTPNDGPVLVACDNPQHPNRRFSCVALAESYLLGNAVMGDCMRPHAVSEPMRELGELLASLMPDPADSDGWENAR